jgi:hypothetical protein
MSPLAAVAAAVDGECSDFRDMASGGVAAAGFLAFFDAAVSGAVAFDACRRVPVAEVCNVSGSPVPVFDTSTAAVAAVFPPPDAFRADPVADGVSMAAPDRLVDPFASFAGRGVASVGTAAPGVTFVALTAAAGPLGAFPAVRRETPAEAPDVLVAVFVALVAALAGAAFAAVFAGAFVAGAFVALAAVALAAVALAEPVD